MAWSQALPATFFLKWRPSPPLRSKRALARLIEDAEQAAGPAGAALHPAAEGGAAGEEVGRQQDGQQGPRLLQAQAQSRGSDGELVSPARGAVVGLRQPVPQWAVLVAQ